MKTPTVIISTRQPQRTIDIVQAGHPDLEIHGCDSLAALPDLIARTGAEVVYSIRFDAVTPFPRAALLQSDTVRWLAVGGSGTDHLGAWDPSHVTVTNSAGSAADMMAEYALGTMLSFSLGLRTFQKAQVRREWLGGARVRPIEGATLLIVGLGQTGCATARRAKAMGMQVLGVRARPQETPHVDEVHGIAALPDLWPRADYILVCVPLLPSTGGMIGLADFAAMKPGAVLVDVSRGGVCDETALIHALENGPLAGAALDVFATEPLPTDSPLWAMEHVIITPHCSGVYDGWYARTAEMFVKNLNRYRRGETLSNIVDPARGY
ncbi:D-2-hydroxyacid dehydrogenase [Aestuariivita sp.]|jgi:phosphoglycerate dehydrogenase-like enzyme|uniref:D-2-hydroxyacid dehydrogenase n=1 Tax=Aestuariivita sp. TaxID=1872407 RepID=UPI0021715706|nr:D-2-hydroxyacid dehydrogenase [Aestuariivita sp.]MCE8007367.1 D-2-hydroxyacid dehydrogenase [Aestuariivita sp.]